VKRIEWLQAEWHSYIRMSTGIPSSQPGPDEILNLQEVWHIFPVGVKERLQTSTLYVIMGM